MSSLLKSIYANAPHWFQNLMVTGFDLSYYKRRGGAWLRYRKMYDQLLAAPPDEHLRIQQERLQTFLHQVRDRSSFYRQLWNGVAIGSIRTVDDLRLLPMVTKDDLRDNIEAINTIGRKNAYIGHTGGTTGASLEVRYTWEGFQERQAVLDSFRGWHEWELGKKIAWFSGKTLLGKNDERLKRFWKTDVWFNIRYYSTFHLAFTNIDAYIDDLNRWQPEYLSGFPTNVFEIADHARRTGKKITCSPRAFFSTAETVMPEQSAIIEEQFHTKVIDQYSSSEGAPFIIMCPEQRYHVLPASGIIEILDKNGNPALEGEAVVTSFHTIGTPLVRYRIGDMITMAKPGEGCSCGCGGPIVERIQGRIQDAVWSPERGRINLGNISNCVKYTPGIRKFQIVQETSNRLQVFLETDGGELLPNDKELFLRELRNRVGEKMNIDVTRVETIEREKSGKFRIVKNNFQPNT